MSNRLYFKYGVMGSGKTTELLQIAHDYELANKRVGIFKPQVDTKGDKYIVSRMANLHRQTSLLPIDFHEFDKNIFNHDVILIDEAQFLTKEYVEYFLDFAHRYDVPILCFGLRTTFDGEPFEGASHLFALADSVEEISTRAICKICNDQLSTKNLRLVDGEPTFDGDTVVIDNQNQDIKYIPVCSQDFMALKRSKMKEQLK